MRRLQTNSYLTSFAVLTRHFFGGAVKEGVSKNAFFGGFFFLVFLFGFGGAVLKGQNLGEVSPTFQHVGVRNLPTVSLSFSGLNTEDGTIAIATDGNDNVYTLSFGNGVIKRDSDGNVLDANFITGLSSPLDIAVDEEGFIYIADYLAGGENYDDDGQVKIYDQEGNFLRSIYTSFYRPMGIDVDNQNVYIAEYNSGEQGPERTPRSRIRVVEKETGNVKSVNNDVEIPYRIAVDSQGKVYVSQAGNNDSSVLIFDENLNFQSRLSNVQSPGSVVIDGFDFIYVVEYAERVNFSEFVNFENLGISDAQDIAEDIDNGIAANAFGVKIFSPDLVQINFFKDRIDFPIDITFNNCDRMYLNNAFVEGENIPFFGYLPERIEFDLEIYQRTPTFDSLETPEIICPENITVTTQPGDNFAVVDFVDAEATDNCSATVEQTEGLTSGSEFPVGTHTIEFTATDNYGNEAMCSFSIVVNPSEEEPTLPNFEDCPSDMPNISTDPGECGTIVNFTPPIASDEEGAVAVNLVSDFGPGDEFPVGTTSVVYEATNATGTVTCSFEITVKDNEEPVITSCPDNMSFTVPYGETERVVTYVLPNYTDNCSADIDQTEGLASGSAFPLGTTDVVFTITDDSGNSVECSFEVNIQREDIGAPVFADCPSDMPDINTDAGNCVAIVNFTSPTASDEDGAVAVNLVSDFGPGDEFPVGSTSVVYEATNATGTVTCIFEITVTDDEDPFASCVTNVPKFQLVNGTVTIDPLNIDDGSSDNCGNLSYRLSDDTFTSPGVKTVILFVEDEAGNISDCTTNIEILPPAATPIDCQLTTIYLDENGSATLDPAEIFDGNATALEIERLEVDQETFACSDLGSNPVTLTVYYTDGTFASCNTQVAVEDDIDPDVNCVTTGKVFSLINGLVTIDPEDINEGSNDNCSFEMSLSPNTFTTTGNKTVTLLITDSSGNTSQCTTHIEIIDSPPSSVACKPVQLSLGANGTATLNPADIFDGDPDAPEIENLSVDKQEFTCDDLGNSTPVTLTVTYTDGTSANCTTQVTVVDNIDPVAACVSEFTLYLNEDGYGILSETIIDDGSTDNCGIVEMELDKTRFTTADVGENTVTLTVFDAAGNWDSCESTVTVVPYDEGGQVTCTESIELPLDENGEAVLTLNYTGNQDNEEVSVSKANFTCDDLGSETITATYWGEYTGSCDIEIVVVDNLAPDVDCVQEYDVQLDEAGTASISVEDIDLGSTDNCGVYRRFLSKYNFTTADVGRQLVNFTVVDYSENENSCQVVVNVKPYFATTGGECKDSFTLPLGSNGEAVLTARDLYAGDPEGVNFSGEVTFGCEDLGVHEITLRNATNPDENCTVVVTVVDQLKPQARCAANFEVRLNANGRAEISAEDFGNSSFDNCEIDSYSLDRFSFTSDDVGEQEVVLTVKDASGNEDSCTGTVTVLPYIPPVEELVCVGSVTLELNANGEAFLDAESLYSGGPDSVEVRVDKENFTCSDIGEQNVIFSYTTPEGEGSCEITVVVKDPESYCEPTYIVLYPNPSRGLVEILVSPNTVIQRAEIFDMRGRFLFVKEFEQESGSRDIYNLDLRGFQSGVYNVKLMTEEDVHLRRAIISGD